MLKNVSRFTRPLAFPVVTTSSGSGSSSTSDLPYWPRPQPVPVPPPILPTAENPNPYDPSRRVRVFWDSENMASGKAERSLRFLTKIKKLIGRPVDSIRMYEDIESTNRGVEALEAAGVTCVRFAAGGRKEVADYSLINDVWAYAYDYPCATIVLITKDSDFAYPMHKLAQRGHEVILVTTRRFIRSSTLCSATTAARIIDCDSLQYVLDYDTEGKLRPPRIGDEIKIEAVRQASEIRERHLKALQQRRKMELQALGHSAFQTIGVRKSRGWAYAKAFLMYLNEQPVRHYYDLYKIQSSTKRSPFDSDEDKRVQHRRIRVLSYGRRPKPAFAAFLKDAESAEATRKATAAGKAAGKTASTARGPTRPKSKSVTATGDKVDPPTPKLASLSAAASSTLSASPKPIPSSPSPSSRQLPSPASPKSASSSPSLTSPSLPGPRGIKLSKTSQSGGKGPRKEIQVKGCEAIAPLPQIVSPPSATLIAEQTTPDETPSSSQSIIIPTSPTPSTTPTSTPSSSAFITVVVDPRPSEPPTPNAEPTVPEVISAARDSIIIDRISSATSSSTASPTPPSSELNTVVVAPPSPAPPPPAPPAHRPQPPRPTPLLTLLNTAPKPKLKSNFTPNPSTAPPSATDSSGLSHTFGAPSLSPPPPPPSALVAEGKKAVPSFKDRRKGKVEA